MTELGIKGAAAGAAAEALKEARSAAKSAENNLKTEKKDTSEPSVKQKIEDKKQISNEGSAKGHVSIFDDPFTGKKPILCTTPEDPMDRILKKMMNNPKETVETIRNAKGGERDNALLSFQSKIDKMGEFDLKRMRDYLVNEMASPSNKDDELLGALLGKVNSELDSRDSKRVIWDEKPIPLFEKNMEKFMPVEQDIIATPNTIEHKINKE